MGVEVVGNGVGARVGPNVTGIDVTGAEVTGAEVIGAELTGAEVGVDVGHGACLCSVVFDDPAQTPPPQFCPAREERGGGPVCR